jgi:hypothetical protein
MRGPVRRFVFPVLIIAIAAFLTIKGKSDRAAQSRAVEAFALQAVSGGPLGATEELIATALRQRLPRNRSLTVEVRDGDGGPAPDGSASHVVMVRVDDLAYLGLRCRYDSDPGKMAIVGVFDAGTEPAADQPRDLTSP